MNKTFKSVIFIALTLFAALPLEAQTSKLYVPALQATKGADLGLALVNPTLTATQVVLTARTYQGSIINNNKIVSPLTLTLPALSQQALQAREIFGPEIFGQSGWIEISTSEPAVKGFFLAFDSSLTYIDGAELAAPSDRLVFPKVTADPSSPTRLSLVNTGAQATQGTVFLYDNSGQLTGSWSVALPAFSGFSGTINELVPAVGAGFEGYVVIDSKTTSGSPLRSLVGMETYRNSSDIALVPALPESARLRTGFLPYLVSQGGWATTLTLVNFSSESQTLRITADGLAVNGTARTPSSVVVERTLAPYARLEELADQMFNFTGDALISGYIRFDTLSNTPGVFGFLDYGTTDGVVLTAVEAQGGGYSDISFLHVAESSVYYTGIALVNANNEASIVTLDAFLSSGNISGSTTVTLKPGEQQAKLISEFFHRNINQTGGYIRVTSTRPIFAFQLFGSRKSSTFLSNIPAQGSRLTPQVSGRTVGASRGAHVMSNDGSASLLIPPGALKGNAAINLAPISVANMPAPDVDQIAVSAVEATPSGTQFQIPVRLNFPLNVNLDPDTQIPLLIFDPKTGKYVTSGFTAIVDGSGRNASAAVTHFTQYVASMGRGLLLQVSSISPLTVSPGDTITITGSGFSTKLSQNVVTFAGPANTSIQAVVQSSTTTTMKATVPSNAVAGPVIVRIGSKTSTGIVVTVVTINPPPGTISISPSTVVSSSSSVDVQISGTSFVPGAIVNYDNNPMSAKFVDKTLLVLTLLSSQLTPTIHAIYVSNPAPGGGTSNSADLAVVDPSTNQAPTVNAGSDQTITLPSLANLSGTATDDGLPSGSVLTTTWSKISGPGIVAFGNANALSTTASFSAAGSYVLRLTASDSALSSSDDLAITVNSAPANQPPAVSAGVSQTITLPALANLVGTATDDGLPTGSTLKTTWSQISGPATVMFGNVNALSTTASFSTSGSYVLRLTATDSALSSTADVTIIVNPANQPPVVTTCCNQTITLPSSANLSGTATDDGLPTGSTLTTTWSKFSGPGTVTFGNANALSTSAGFSTFGTYVLRLTASDTALSGSADVTIVVNPALSTSRMAAYSLSEAQGSTSVDSSGNGNALSLTQATWAIGKYGNGLLFDGSLSFASASSTSSLSLGSTGTIEAWIKPTVLGRWGSVLAKGDSNSDSVHNYGMEVMSGNQVLCVLGDGTNANIVTSAGMVNTTQFTHLACAWDGTTVRIYINGVLDTSGSQTVIPAANTSPLYIGQYGAGSDLFSGVVDEVRIYNRALAVNEIQYDMATPLGSTTPTNQAPIVNAGPDQIITLPASANLRGSATDDGLPTGSVLTTTWSKVSGPGTVSFGNVNTLSTTASFSTTGTYTMRLTATDTALTTTDDIIVTVNPTVSTTTNQAPTVNAGPDQTITLPGSATLSGTAADDGLPTGSVLTTTWSKVSGPGMVSLSNANALSTIATFSTSGSYVLRLTASDSLLSSSDDVTVIVNAVATGMYFIDFVNGSDANNATSKSTPWQHAPGMPGCTSICATTTPAAGNQFIFKGGVTWPNSSLPMTWRWSGTPANPIIIGVDKTWFSGTSWTRPIWDLGNAVPAGGYNMFLRFVNAQSYVTVDDFEWKNQYWAGSPSYATLAWAVVYDSTYITFDHLYIHHWTHASSGASDASYGFLGNTSYPYSVGTTIQNSVVDGSDGSSDSGAVAYCIPNAKNNVIHDIPNGILPCGHGEISGNRIYNITTSFTGNHENFLETLVADSTGTFYIHDNVFHSGIGEAAFLGNPNEIDYVWNNLWYDLRENAPELVQNVSPGTAAYFWNNTIVAPGGGYCLRQGHAATTPTVVFQNNHCITTASQAVDPTLQAGTLVIDHNTLQTPTTASGQGYTATETFVFSPTEITASTVGAGTNLSSQATGSLKGLNQDTFYACTVDATNHVSCPVRTSKTRPSSGTWSSGAYQ